MKIHAFCLFVLLAAVTARLGQTGAAPPAKDGADELDKKIKMLGDQVDELRKKLDDLIKESKAQNLRKSELEREAKRKEAEQRKKEEAERQAKEEAEKKTHYAKVEVRGKLAKLPHLNPKAANVWLLTINELTWTLKFGDDKELLALAEKNAGKGVVITGTIANNVKPTNPMNLGGAGGGYSTFFFPPGIHGYTGFGHTFLQPMPGGFMGSPSAPMPYYQPEAPTVVNVQTLKLAEK